MLMHAWICTRRDSLELFPCCLQWMHCLQCFISTYKLLSPEWPFASIIDLQFQVNCVSFKSLSCSFSMHLVYSPHACTFVSISVTAWMYYSSNCIICIVCYMYTVHVCIHECIACELIMYYTYGVFVCMMCTVCMVCFVCIVSIVQLYIICFAHVYWVRGVKGMPICIVFLSFCINAHEWLLFLACQGSRFVHPSLTHIYASCNNVSASDLQWTCPFSLWL